MKRNEIIQNSILGALGLLIFYGLLFYARSNVPIHPLDFNEKSSPITSTSSTYTKIRAILNNPVSILVPIPISIPPDTTSTTSLPLSSTSTAGTDGSATSTATSTDSTDASSTPETDATSTTGTLDAGETTTTISTSTQALPTP